MKAIYFLMVFLLSLFLVEATYYQCEVNVDLKEGVDFGFMENGVAWVSHDAQNCYDYKFRTHICQIYGYDLDMNQMQNYCEDFCLKRANFPKNCKVLVNVKESTNIEAHQEKNKMENVVENNEIIQKIINFFQKIKNNDQIDNLESEEESEEKNQEEYQEDQYNEYDNQYDNQLDSNQNLIQENLEKKKNIVEKVKNLFEKKCDEGFVLFEKECVPDCDFDEKWNGKECILDKPLKPNEYEIMYNDRGEKIMKFVDSYGQEKYTKDGKYFYDSYGQASVNNPIRNAYHSVKEGISGISDFFFKTKLKDKDEELKREISREVLSEFKKDGKKEKTIENIEEKVGGLADSVLPKHLKDLVSVPANSVKDFAKEARATEFAEGASIYMKYRDEGMSTDQLYQNSPEELIYGGIGGGVAQGLNSEFPKAVLFSKYEESYQRYKLAKELGREK
ncbi:MAG: hypothetical protein PHT94_00150 [Candidatus Nanoarchaeia archaeon]|nr:hypothetical protein [Candidatus Nanoarchaeia archaeon]